MAIYEAPKPASTSSGFGQGIAKAFNDLTQHKLQKMQERMHHGSVSNALKNLGIPEEVAFLPENLQQVFLKQHLAQPQQQAFAEALSGLLGGNEQTQTQQAPMQQGTPKQGSQIAPQLQQAMNPNQQQAQQPMQKQVGTKIPAGLNAQQATQIAQLGLKKQAIEEQKRQFMSKQELEQQKREDRKQIHYDKETAPAYKEIEDLARAANDSDIRLGRMEELNESGGLNSTTFESLLRTAEGILPFGMHLDLTALRSADSQEFNKLSTDFLKDAKKFFGASVTDSEIKLFLKTVPQLTNSPEGRRRVIQNLRLFNDAAKVRADIADNIIEENGGNRPSNFKSLVERRSKKQLDDIAQTFKYGLRSKEQKNERIQQGTKLPKLGGGLDNPMDILGSLTGLLS